MPALILSCWRGKAKTNGEVSLILLLVTPNTLLFSCGPFIPQVQSYHLRNNKPAEAVQRDACHGSILFSACLLSLSEDAAKMQLNTTVLYVRTKRHDTRPC